MKTIVVEGNFDCFILNTLFPDSKVKIRIAQGFSNVLSVSRTLIDYGFDVLIVLDTDTNVSGLDNRMIIQRLMNNDLIDYHLNIVWMDSCIEIVLGKVSSDFINLNKRNKNLIKDILLKNKDAILNLKEFQVIQEFIDK